MFTGIWRTRLSADHVGEALVDTTRWLTSGGAPFAFWWVDEDATPPDLGDRLTAAGWVPWEVGAPGMAARLDELDFDALGGVRAGYRQVRVQDEAELQDFGRAFVAGFEVPEWAGVASVFGVAVAPSARGRGIGAAITLAAFDEARAAGYQYGVLFATELGAPVYRRIGFRDVEATMSRYLWQGAGAD